MASEHLERSYQAKTAEELRQVYRDWAEHYDQELVHGLGWDKPARVCQVLLPYLPPEASILDVGAGTGLVGQFLHEQGLRKLSALDFSPEMLEQAKKRDVYQRFYQCDLKRPLPISQNFDAITAVGIFTEGHLGAEVMPFLKGLLKPGGLLAFSLRDDLQAQYTEGIRLFKVEQQERFSDGLEARPWSAWICRA
ncbi:methyltransferase domain-containing protein [bacterium]|nr:methyltransferase domain-containing protein [bacterium]